MNFIDPAGNAPQALEKSWNPQNVTDYLESYARALRQSQGVPPTVGSLQFDPTCIDLSTGDEEGDEDDEDETPEPETEPERERRCLELALQAQIDCQK